MPTSNFQPIRLLDPSCSCKLKYLMTNSADPDQLSVGFFRSQLIWIYTVCKGRVHLGSAGQGLINIEETNHFGLEKAALNSRVKRKSNCFASPPVFPRPCPMWFLFVSEIESIPCWAEIPVPTGTWICHSSVPYYCAQISVPWRLQEVDTSAETLHF